MISRRIFVRNSSLLAAGSLGLPHLGRSAASLQVQPGQKPRHIIHLVSDGMSMGTLTLADHLAQLLREGRGLSWVKLNNTPGVASAWVNMRSLNSLVTDSAAAASSWGSGSRVINGSLNLLPNGTPLKTLYELFADAGWKRGLVTTTEITHATPAGFAANAEDRGTADLIASQYLERRVDLLLGGGQKFFDAKERRDKRDLRADYRAAGYTVMQTLDELKAAPTDRPWLGIFDRSHLPFTLDHEEDPKLRARVPSLAQMTARALEWMGKEPHFILQVEGGRVDHACHNCDAVAALRDQIAFDEALDVCLEFQKKVPDTLLVITTDHGNGNPGLNGLGVGYGQSSFLFDNVLQVKKSFPELLKLLRKTERVKLPEYAARLEQARAVNPHAHPAGAVAAAAGSDEEDDEPQEKRPPTDRELVTVRSVSEIMDVFRTHAGYPISARRVELLAPYLAKNSLALFDHMNNDLVALGQVMANHLGIGWVGNAHTADYVLLTALGPGAERFRGFLENTEIFHHYLALVGIQFRNPSEPLAAGVCPPKPPPENLAEYALA